MKSASCWIIALFLTTFCSSTACLAADSTSTRPSIVSTVGSDIATVWGDIGPFFTRPASFDKNDWFITGVVLGGTAAATLADSSGRRIALSMSHASSTNSTMDVFRHYGDLYGILGACGIAYLGGLAFNNDWLRVTGRELIETLAFAGTTSGLLKFVIGRSRPFTGAGNYSFHPFSFTNDYYSMPSGHTTVAFSISSVLAARIDHPVATVLLYGIAATTAFSRMYHDQHWFSDTFLGAAIATTTGLWVTHRDEEGRMKHDSIPDQGLIISPTIGGLSLTYKF